LAGDLGAESDEHPRAEGRAPHNAQQSYLLVTEEDSASAGAKMMVEG